MDIRETMTKIKFYAFVIGLVLVSSVIVKFASTGIIYLIENYRYKGNPAAGVISAYMADTTSLQVSMPDADLTFRDDTAKVKDSIHYFNYKDTYYHQPARQTYSRLLNKRATDDDLLKVTFYSAAYHKFFILIMPDVGYKPSDLYFDVLPLKTIRLTVNKQDFASPRYGTLANPVPVFLFSGVKPLLYKGKNYDESQDDFRYNVTQYLSFIMPAKLFKARFPDAR